MAGMGEEGGRIDLKLRTRGFALRIIRLYVALPKTEVAQVLGKQVLRSGTSVGAQYREGVRSRSNAEYAAKIEGALQELEETLYWLELLSDSETVPEPRLAELRKEADELSAILSTCAKSARARKPRN